MAKVCILTFHYANNYGAVLQAYGLVKVIQSIGHDVEVIDYRPLAARRFYGRWPRNPCNIFHAVRLSWKFNRFRKIYLPLTKIYLSTGELEMNPPDSDYIVCGSDQIWNISSYRGFDPAFFLEFVKDKNIKRISYAACSGNIEDFGDYRNRILNLLSLFDHISVRDIKTKQIVDGLINQPVEHVLDPCFLTDYNPITPAPIVKHPYILVYYFGKSELASYTVEKLGNYFNMPVISLMGKFDGVQTFHACPLQFLSLIQNAHFVCTNSFHGTYFSIINKKNFTVLPNKGRMSRIDDILKTVGLSGMHIKSENELEKILSKHVEYEEVNEKLDNARKNSLLFLRQSLC